jgi:hypothetical protein
MTLRPRAFSRLVVALGAFGAFGAFAPGARAANTVHAVIETLGTNALQNAIDAASDGDVILVRTGLYGGVTIVDKALTIVADEDYWVKGWRVSYLRVQNLAAGKRVTFRGFMMGGSFNPFPPHDAIALENNQGTIVIEDCYVWKTIWPASGLLAVNCASAFLVRCSFTGTDGFNTGPPEYQPKPAVLAQNSSLHFHDCTLQGGHGKPSTVGNPNFNPPLAGQDGAPGLLLLSCRVLLSGSVATGGNGGAGGVDGGNCFPSGNGGSGVWMHSGPSVVRVFDSTTAGGLGGTHAICGPGAPGVGVDPTSGSLIVKSEPARTLFADRMAREGEALDLEVLGQPGETFFLLFSPVHHFTTTPNGAYVPGLQGALLPGGAFGILSLGPLPAGGELALSIPASPGALPVSIDGAEILLQGLVAANGLGLLSSPTSFTLVKSTF